MNFDLAGQIDDIEHLLLQKRDGRFYLAIWANVLSYDIELKQDIHVSDRHVTLELNYPTFYANVYRPMDSTAPIQSYQSPEIITLHVPDHPLIIEFEISPLPPPTDLQADFNTISRQTILQWTDNTTGPDQEDGFIVQRKPDRPGFQWTTLSLLEPDTTIYIDASGFDGFVEYRYRVGTYRNE